MEKYIAGALVDDDERKDRYPEFSSPGSPRATLKVPSASSWQTGLSVHVYQAYGLSTYGDI
jgi:hypothetical protein